MPDSSESPDDGEIDVKHLDATGLRCPLPVLRARKVLKGMAPGGTLVVRTTDLAAPADFEAFCKEAGHEFLGVGGDGDCSVISLRKARSAV